MKLRDINESMTNEGWWDKFKNLAKNGITGAQNKKTVQQEPVSQEKTSKVKPTVNLVKPWIDYLKNNQIVALQSDLNTGALKYKRSVTTDDLKKFLHINTEYTQAEINSAIDQVVGDQQNTQSEPHVGATTPEPQTSDYNLSDQAMNMIKTFGGRSTVANLSANMNNEDLKELQPVLDKLVSDGKLTARPAPDQDHWKDIYSLKTENQPPIVKKRPSGKVPGQLSQTPDAIRKRASRAQSKNTISEDFKDIPGIVLSEKDIEHIFTILTQSNSDSVGHKVFKQMAQQLSGNRPNTMANTSVSKTNRANTNNLNLASPIQENMFSSDNRQYNIKMAAQYILKK